MMDSSSLVGWYPATVYGSAKSSSGCALNRVNCGARTMLILSARTPATTRAEARATPPAADRRGASETKKTAARALRTMARAVPDSEKASTETEVCSGDLSTEKESTAKARAAAANVAVMARPTTGRVTG